jgi:hypothetical protein
MNYKRKQVGSKSMWIHTYPNGAEVMISYQTPIAAYIPALGFLKTKEKFSATTRHGGVWAKSHGYPLVTEVEQAEIVRWVEDLNAMRMEG